MISGATTLSVQLAIALLTLLFYHHNLKISAEKHFCSTKIKPVAPVETNVTNCNALTGNAEFETESGDDKVRQPQFSTELDLEDGKIFHISENSFASSNHRRTGNFLPGGAVNHLRKQLLQVAQIFTKQSNRNEGHTMQQHRPY